MDWGEHSLARRFSPLFIYSILLVIADQYTKYLIMQNFELYESIPVIDGFFNLTYVANPGAAFGFMAGVASEWVGRVFILISLAASALIVAIYAELEEDAVFMKIALTLILSGAVGNLVDRVRFGKVTDFLDFYISSYHWPAFNVADSCITIGVLMLVGAWVYSAVVDRGHKTA